MIAPRDTEELVRKSTSEFARSEVEQTHIDNASQRLSGIGLVDWCRPISSGQSAPAETSASVLRGVHFIDADDARRCIKRAADIVRNRRRRSV